MPFPSAANKFFHSNATAVHNYEHVRLDVDQNDVQTNRINSIEIMPADSVNGVPERCQMSQSRSHRSANNNIENLRSIIELNEQQTPCEHEGIQQGQNTDQHSVRGESNLNATDSNAANKADRALAKLARQISAAGIFISFYNQTLINNAKPLMRQNYGQPTPLQESLMTSASLAGSALGQVFLSPLADVIGRKRASLLSGGLMTAGALACVMARPISGEPASIYTHMSIARFILGMGAGADYPVMSAITAENSEPEHSANALIDNTIMVGLGSTFTQLVYSLLIPTTSTETAWRAPATLGAMLTSFALVQRALCLPTAQDTSQVDSEEVHRPDQHTSTDNSLETNALMNESLTHRSILEELSQLKIPIIGAATCWFLYDIVDFSLGMSSADILGTSDSLESGAVAAMLTTSIFTLGALLSKPLIEPQRLGRYHLQKLGFMALGLSHLTLCALAGHLWSDPKVDQHRQVVSDTQAKHIGFVALYILQQLLDAAGPSIGIYLVPSEIFPSKIKATCLSMASSSGKLGAFLGAASMPFIRDRWGLPAVFFLTGMLSLLGSAVTARLIPKYGLQTLAQLETAFRESGSQGVMHLLYPDRLSEVAQREDRSHEAEVVSVYINGGESMPLTI